MTARTSLFLMANLGSEVEGLFSAAQEKKEKQLEEIRERAGKILAELLSLPDMQARRGEIELLREAIFDIASPRPLYEVDRKSFESYFLPFALRTVS